MESGDKTTATLLFGIVMLLIALLALQGTSFYFARQERLQRHAAVEQAQKTIAEIEEKRVQIFTDMVSDLNSSETKSIYHQIFHVTNAEMKLNNLVVQENEALLFLLASRS